MVNGEAFVNAMAVPLFLIVVLFVLIGYWVYSMRKQFTFLLQENERLRYEMQFDGLTGLLNRTTFETELGRLMGLLTRSGNHQRRRSALSSLTLFFIDVDHFKSVNDTYGHQVGDEVLQRVAHTIKQTLRDSDHIGRWGGEEIVVALPNVCADDAVTVAEKVRQAVKVLAFNESDLYVTVSIGVACTQAQTDRASLVRAADQAVYYAKDRGRDQVVYAK